MYFSARSKRCAPGPTVPRSSTTIALTSGCEPAFSPRRKLGGADRSEFGTRNWPFLHRNFLRFHALTAGLSGGTNRQEKCMNNPNQPKPSQPQQGNPRPGQQQGGGGQKPGQQQQGGGQQKPGQQPGQGGHQGGQQGGRDRGARRRPSSWMAPPARRGHLCVGLMCTAPSNACGHVFSSRELAYDFAWPRPRSRCSISTAIRLTIRPSTLFTSRRSPRAPPF